jgi:broad specificity phosphatase PhoE
VTSNSLIAGARLYLVRHGEVENPRGVVYGHLPGFGLSVRGRAQVRAAAAYLGGRLRGRPELFTSPLQRAVETAELLAEDLGAAEPEVALVPEVDARLSEAGSILDGLPRRFAPAAYLGRWLDATARARQESPSHVLARMVAALREILSRAAAAGAAAGPADGVVVSHQFPIAMARVAARRGLLGRGDATAGLGRAGQALVERAPWLFARGRCAPGSVTGLSFEAGEVSVDYWEPAPEPMPDELSGGRRPRR